MLVKMILHRENKKMEKIQTLAQAASRPLRVDAQRPSANLARISANRTHGEVVSAENLRLHNFVAPRLHTKFTCIYQAAWTSKYQSKEERTGLIYPYVEAVAKVGGMEHKGLKKFKRVLDWLSSTENKKHVSFPPNPQEFLLLLTELKELEPAPRRISKKGKITLKARVYSGICKLAAGASVEDSHADIKDLVLANYELFKKHTDKHGIPIPGAASAKNYCYFEPILDLEETK